MHFCDGGEMCFTALAENMFHGLGRKICFYDFGGKMCFCNFGGKIRFCDFGAKCVLLFWWENAFCGFAKKMRFLVLA